LITGHGINPTERVFTKSPSTAVTANDEKKDLLNFNPPVTGTVQLKHLNLAGDWSKLDVSPHPLTAL